MLSKDPARTATPWWRWAVVLLPGVLLYFLPIPLLNPQQRHLLAVFAATIISLVAQPVKMGVSVVVAMTLLAVTGDPAARQSALRLQQSHGLDGLRRLPLLARRNRHRLRHARGLHLHRAFRADPSESRLLHRCGRPGPGALHPVRHGSRRRCCIPDRAQRGVGLRLRARTDRGRIGSFLTLVSFHITYPASAIFLTGMAANPLIAEFAFKIGHVELTWMRWFSGSVAPGICTLALVPWLLYRWVKPEI